MCVCARAHMRARALIIPTICREDHPDNEREARASGQRPPVTDPCPLLHLQAKGGLNGTRFKVHIHIWGLRVLGPLS